MKKFLEGVLWGAAPFLVAAVALVFAVVVTSCTTPPPGSVPPASVDTATELNAWMSDHRVTDLAGRTVNINDGTVRPPAGATLRNGRLVRTVNPATRVFPHVEVTGADVTLSTLVIVGAATLLSSGQPALVYDPAREGQHGIKLSGAVRTTLRAVNISWVWGDGIYMGSNTRDVDAVGVVVDGAGRGGIVATDVDGAVFDNAYVDQIGLWMVNLEPHGSGRFVRDFRLSRFATDVGSIGSRGPWLNAAGPTLTSMPFDCAMTATIDRPTGIRNTATTRPRTRIAPCVTGITITGSY